MACDLETIQTNACTSGIACVDSEKLLLVIIAQLLCEIQEAGGGGGSATAPQGGVVDPEGVVTAVPYTIYTNTANNTFWIKTSGSGNTGWTQFI